MRYRSLLTFVLACAACTVPFSPAAALESECYSDKARAVGLELARRADVRHYFAEHAASARMVVRETCWQVSLLGRVVEYDFATSVAADPRVPWSIADAAMRERLPWLVTYAAAWGAYRESLARRAGR